MCGKSSLNQIFSAVSAPRPPYCTPPHTTDRNHNHTNERRLVGQWPDRPKQIKRTCRYKQDHDLTWYHCLFKTLCNILLQQDGKVVGLNFRECRYYYVCHKCTVDGWMVKVQCFLYFRVLAKAVTTNVCTVVSQSRVYCHINILQGCGGKLNVVHCRVGGCLPNWHRTMSTVKHRDGR